MHYWPRSETENDLKNRWPFKGSGEYVWIGRLSRGNQIIVPLRKRYLPLLSVYLSEVGFCLMKLMLRPEWRLWPLSSFLGFLDLKSGVIVALLFAVSTHNIISIDSSSYKSSF